MSQCNLLSTAIINNWYPDALGFTYQSMATVTVVAYDSFQLPHAIGTLAPDQKSHNWSEQIKSALPSKGDLGETC